MEEMAIHYLQGIQNPTLDNLFYAITMLADQWTFLLIFCTVYWCFNKRIGFEIGVVLLTTSAVNTTIKNYFQELRPFETLQIRAIGLETAGGYSFPSGHSQTTSSFFSYLALRRSRRIIAPAVILTVLVACSRVYMGVHWPRDVIYGIAIGMGVAGLAYLVQRLSNDILLGVFMVLMLSSFFALPVEIGRDFLTAYSSLIGIMIGRIFESQFVNFGRARTLPAGIGRVLYGLIITAAAFIVLQYFLKDHPFIIYLTSCFIATGLVPLAFEKEMKPY